MPTDAGRRRRHGCLVTSVLLVAALALGTYGVDRYLVPRVTPELCRVTVGTQTLTYTPEQMRNAATISAVGVRRKLPRRAVTIALATAMQESKLRNLDYGDRDSLGLFQQRPSQGWGTPDQLQDPVYASDEFYKRLVRVRGYLDEPLTEVAQEVQRSGYPDAYARHEERAALLAEAFTGAAPAALTCSLSAPTSSSSPQRVASRLRTEAGVTTRTSPGLVTAVFQAPETAWLVGHWAVAHAEDTGAVSVTVHNRTWTRGRDGSATKWTTSDAGAGAGATEVRISFSR